MLLQRTTKPSQGTCDVCDKNTEVWPMHNGSISMCSECRDAEIKAIESSKSVNKILTESRAVDSTVQLKQDIYLAKTVPAIELRAAIEADESIPTDQKEYAYAKETMARFLTFKQAVAEDRAKLLEKENEMRMWQVNAQTSAGKLRVELREQFKALDVNYAPAPLPKKVKTTKPVTSKKFDKNELYAVAKKYGVPSAGVQSIVVSRNLSYEDAAKQLAGLMGLPTEV